MHGNYAALPNCQFVLMTLLPSVILYKKTGILLHVVALIIGTKCNCFLVGLTKCHICKRMMYRKLNTPQRNN